MTRLIPLIFTALSPAGAVAAPPTVDQVVDGIQAFYKEAADLKADFTQTYTYKVYGRKQVSSGSVYFKKPRKMRWDYTRPRPKVFVADGATLWVYEPEENQVFKRSLANSQLPVALTFMSGQGDLRAEFSASLISDPDEQVWVVELVPKADAGDYQRLRLRVDRSTFAVRASTVIDPVGNINEVAFTHVKTNVGLPDSGFVFTPPEGVRVLGGAPKGE